MATSLVLGFSLCYCDAVAHTTKIDNHANPPELLTLQVQVIGMLRLLAGVQRCWKCCAGVGHSALRTSTPLWQYVVPAVQ